MCGQKPDLITFLLNVKTSMLLEFIPANIEKYTKRLCFSHIAIDTLKIEHYWIVNRNVLEDQRTHMHKMEKKTFISKLNIFYAVRPRLFRWQIFNSLWNFTIAWINKRNAWRCLHLKIEHLIFSSGHNLLLRNDDERMNDRTNEHTCTLCTYVQLLMPMPMLMLLFANAWNSIAKII